MSENYVNVFDQWEKLMNERKSQEKKKKPDPITTAFLVLASSFGGLTPEKEYKLFKAMEQLVKKENNFKLDQKDSDLVSAILLLAAEINRTGI